MDKTKKYIFIALLTSVALVLSVIESMISLPYISPGAKLGLANMITLTTLVVFGVKSALCVSILRCFLFLMVAGNPIAFIYSIFAGVFSVLVMYFIYKHFSKYFSLVGVSVFGSLAHNFAQIIVASVMLQNLNILTYYPIMSIVSLFTGCFVGYVSIYLVNILKKYYG